MPHNLRARTNAFVPSREAQAEVARVNDVWTASVESGGGPYLFGERFTVADCMYMPMVSRFRTYGITASGAYLSQAAQRYCAAIWEHPTVRELEALAADAEAIPRYDVGLAE